MDARTRMEIEWACVGLSHAFAYHMDRRNYAEVAALFTPDGLFVRHDHPLRGRAQIIEALETRPAEQFTRHVTTSHHFIEVGETRARAVMFNVSYFSFDAAVLPAAYDPANALLLDFTDVYEKTREGWRFAERVTSAVFLAKSLMGR